MNYIYTLTKGLNVEVVSAPGWKDQEPRYLNEFFKNATSLI